MHPTKGLPRSPRLAPSSRGAAVKPTQGRTLCTCHIRSRLLGEWAELLSAAPEPSALVLTDNLAPFLRSTKRDDAEAYLDGVGLRLLRHDSLWGGAIQFVHADGKVA